MLLTRKSIIPAVLGGAFYGGGGGGSIEMGLALAEAAFDQGQPELADVDSLEDDTLLATCSMVGAPAAPELSLAPEDFLRSVALLEQASGCRLGGFISNENGGVATVNGWLQAAALGLPVADAPANGRAHPTGLMGAMGLNAQVDYWSSQAACGGRRPERYVEATVGGSLAAASSLVRQTADAAGGMVAVCRNPVTAAYVRSHGAPGAISAAIRLGGVLERYYGRPAPEAAAAIAAAAQGQVLTRGRIKQRTVNSRGGFDYGQLLIDSGDSIYQLPVWNEYLAVEWGGCRLAEFPDLITLLDESTNEPLTSAKAAVGQRVALLVVPADQLLLGAGMFYEENFRELREILEGGRQ